MRRKQVRRTGLILALAGLLPAVIFSLLIVMEPLPVRAWRDLVFDGYQRISPRPYDLAQPVRVVAIDDESLDRVGRWPWSRETLAQLLRKLGNAKAAAVAFDVIFSEAESSADGDARLAEAIGAAPTVLGFAGADRGAAFAPKGGFAVQGDDPRLFVPKLTAALLPIRGLQDAAAGLGSINLFPDRDLIVREIPT